MEAKKVHCSFYGKDFVYEPMTRVREGQQACRICIKDIDNYC